MYKSNEFFFLRKIELDDQDRVTPIRGSKIYNREFYEREKEDKKTIDLFFEIIDKIEEIIEQDNLQLKTKTKKYRCSFNSNNSIVFEIDWMQDNSFNVYIKLPKKNIEKYQSKNMPTIEYDDDFKGIVCTIKSINDIDKLLPLLKKAFVYKFKKIHEKKHGEQSVNEFYEIIDKIEQIRKKYEWKLEKNFDAYGCNFKNDGGFDVLFRITWPDPKFNISFAIPKNIAKTYQPKNIHMKKYDNEWNEAEYTIESSKDIDELLSLFKKAVEHGITINKEQKTVQKNTSDCNTYGKLT